MIVVARTSDDGSRSFSLLIVDDQTPAENLLGEEHNAFAYLMERLPRERMSIAAVAQSSADAVYANTRRYVFDREAFGRRVGDFQNTRFVLAEIATELDVARSYFDDCVRALNAGSLTGVEAAKAKWWTTELQAARRDALPAAARRLRLHAGIPRAPRVRRSRIQTICGGATEIMTEIIGRDIASGGDLGRRSPAPSAISRATEHAAR